MAWWSGAEKGVRVRGGAVTCTDASAALVDGQYHHVSGQSIG